LSARTREYIGINIQFPISRLILSGEKTIETRTYPIPPAYVGKELVIIETPGKTGKFKARMIGLVTFGESFQYPSKAAFYRDAKRHRVTPDSLWAWQEGAPKWGWPIIKVKAFEVERLLQKRAGIRFSTGIQL
jgi:hypothetical protein